jgi:hypothetical protein
MADGGGGGGGGGGQPGGAGGPTYGGDEGAYSGTTGQSSSTFTIVSTATNAGAISSAGGSGYAIISYTSNIGPMWDGGTITVNGNKVIHTFDTAGNYTLTPKYEPSYNDPNWRRVKKVFLKDNGVWKLAWPGTGGF